MYALSIQFMTNYDANFLRQQIQFFFYLLDFYMISNIVKNVQKTSIA